MFEVSISNESLEQLPTAAFDGEIVLVDDISLLNNAIAYLKEQKVLGFDTETRPSFKKGAKNNVALLQLAGEEKAYLFRISCIGLPQSLAELLEDDNILKVGAAVKDDINALSKCRKLNAKGFIDLQKLIEDYDIQDKSVKKMAAIILNVRISKSQQLSNWESQTYTDAQKLYAATDAWVCREMYLTLLQHHSKRKKNGRRKSNS
ncbi:MAG: 3'-5' exonuclease domain-containing protein 2 [Prevotellaceae bacterium]|jgi:ribonuclease D|nr:3'-5' exonuclease domain-containing protein 2 [Prevotellaceae bacterium]